MSGTGRAEHKGDIIIAVAGQATGTPNPSPIKAQVVG